MPNNPVQVILNSENFLTVREVNAGGSQKEHFANKDQEFAVHKSALLDQVASAREILVDQPVDLGYAKVSLRRSALAKTNRPFAALFNSDVTPVVGGQDLGEILVRVSSSALARVEREINKSNPETRIRINERTKKKTFAPNIQRSETGGIANIALFGPADRVQFTAQYAVEAFADPRRGGTYYVELFEKIPQKRNWDMLDQALLELFKLLEVGLSELGEGIEVERLDQTDARSPFLSIRLLAAGGPTIMPFSIEPGIAIRDNIAGDQREIPIDLNVDRHRKLLNFLRKHPLVRAVRIAPTFARSAAKQPAEPARAKPDDLAQTAPANGQAYPVVAVIDGGIGPWLRPWVIGTLSYLKAADRDEAHGSFIAGLLVQGQALNGAVVCPEADGCQLVDVDIFPSENNPKAFTEYFPSGPKDFFEALEDAILRCRRDYNVRIFNLSINGDQLASLDTYSYEARKLDRIAAAADVIIVVSTGNADLAPRPEWPPDPNDALSDLAITRDDTLQIPAETVSNVSVSALNPPGVSRAISHALACYSRRGPGLRSGIKPDYSHFGGAKVQGPITTSGLYSVDPAGHTIENRGTSFAAPLIAKTFAALDAKIQGDVSRETLIALVTHNSHVKSPLDQKVLNSISRHLVGYGLPESTDEMLTCADHQVTLVFAARLMPDKMLRFPFSWPQSLVDANGRCRGRGRFTLVFSPPLNYVYGAEFVRVNLEAALQQEDPEKGGWDGHAHQVFMEHRRAGQVVDETERIRNGLKWSTTKQYAFNFPIGKGKSSNWRVEVDYLERNFVKVPKAGIPFSLLLTIEDPKGEATGLFNEVRQWLQNTGTTISDIQTAARIGART